MKSVLDEMNIWHDELGKFRGEPKSKADKDKSSMSRNVDRGAKMRVTGVAKNGKTQFKLVPNKCGRPARKAGKDFHCKTGKPAPLSRPVGDHHKRPGWVQYPGRASGKASRSSLRRESLNDLIFTPMVVEGEGIQWSMMLEDRAVFVRYLAPKTYEYEVLYTGDGKVESLGSRIMGGTIEEAFTEAASAAGVGVWVCEGDKCRMVNGDDDEDEDEDSDDKE